MSETIAVNSIIAGQYQVQAVLHGGMGTVLPVLDLQNDRTLILKTFRDELVFNTDFLHMFKDEALIWIRLGSHPNIVKAYKITEQDSRPFLALEYIRPDMFMGVNLRQRMERMIIPVSSIIDYALQFCRGMVFAQQCLGNSNEVFIHGDIKPENILVSPSGIIKITDFGLARVAGRCALAPAFGTPGYMAPELFKSRVNEGISSDIYSFGCVLYELVSDSNPFCSESSSPLGNFEVISNLQKNKIPKNPDRLYSDCPQLLQEIIISCLEKNPRNRIPDFEALLSALSPLSDTVEIKENYTDSVPASNTSMEKAVSFASLGNNTEAAAAYSSLLATTEATKEETYLLYCFRGNARAESGLTEQAFADFEKAIAFFPRRGEAFFLRAHVYNNAAEYEKALKDYDRAKQKGISKGLVDYNRGLCRMRMGLLQEAIKDFTDAIEAGFRLAFTNRAAVCFRLGKEDKALQDCNQALEINPRNAIAYTNRAAIFRNRELYDQALDDLDAAITINPDYLLAWFHLGGIWNLLGNPKKALEYMEKGLALPQNTKSGCFEINPAFTRDEWNSIRYIMYHDCGLLYHQMGEYSRAQKYFSLFIHNTPAEYTDKQNEVINFMQTYGY